MAKISIQTTRTAMPRCYCYTTPTISDHDGWVKIGYTEQDDVEDRIRQQLQTAHIPHHTEWEMEEKIVSEMAEADNLTEEMKNTDQLKWVGMMNNYRHSAQEIIIKELIETE